LLLLLLLAPLGAAALQYGDVLVVDQLNNRILRVDPNNGSVTEFTAGNLLSLPQSIAVDPDTGEIVVLQANDPQLVSIDPATRHQFAVGQSLLLGAQPTGLTMSPRAPSIFSSRVLFVSCAGSLFEVDRPFFGSASTTNLSAYPSPNESAVGNFVAARDPGGPNPLDIFVATSAKILLYTSSPMTEYWTLPQTTLQGLGYDPLDQYGNGDRLFFSYQYVSCPSDFNGVFYFDLRNGLTPPQAGFGDVSVIQTGGNLACPGAIALSDLATGSLAGAPFPIYVVDVGSIPPRIVEVTEPGVNHVAATLPEGSNATGLAVYTPEPHADSLELVAGSALLVLRRRRSSGVH
jgi:hypothetical protein